MNVAEAAYAWQAQGVSTIPILANQTKRPLVRWNEYQVRLPSLGEVSEWWGNGHNYGLALIMGKVSGDCEMLELEGRAWRDEAKVAELMARIEALGVGEVWDRLYMGYSEESPSGGLHLIYRLADGPVPGNTKIARRPATEEELADNPGDKIKVLVETRGEGGYVIVAPSSGLCHPSGEPWKLISGTAGQMPTITMAERDLIFQALVDTFNVTYTDNGAADLPHGPATSSAPDAPTLLPAVVERGAELRPGDDFDTRVGWDQILQDWHRGPTQSDGTVFWTRPGKDPRDGHSASTGHAADRDRLFVWSSATPFPTEESITKFRAFSILNFNGDDGATAGFLASRGFGDPASRLPQQIPDFLFQQLIHGLESFDDSDQGNAAQLHAKVGGRVVWSEEEKRFLSFDGTMWRRDDSYPYQAMVEVAQDMCRSSDPAVKKWGKKSRSDASIMAALRAFRHRRGVTVSSSKFNTQRHLLNLHNGTLDLATGILRSPAAEDMITQQFNASYDPQATCPKFLAFIGQVLPDPEVRAYVQRAIGSTLLGEAGSRALYLIHGPSGTGKTQFLELCKHLFATYGTTAPASTFRAKRDSAPPHDLHRLRGRRFVATSETSDSAQFDEELLKRLTGGDTISSRDLYESFQDWVPECNIWMATNFAPQFNSDDNAMWKRAKLIPFTTVFGESDGAPAAVANFARNHLFGEADGILNWLLEGLRDFQAAGLQEPAKVGEAVAQLRLESDPVAQFVEESTTDGQLVLGSEERIRSVDLHLLYHEWCRRQGTRWVGQRRFMNRIMSSFPALERVKSNGIMMIAGIGRAANLSALGGFQVQVAD